MLIRGTLCGLVYNGYMITDITDNNGDTKDSLCSSYAELIKHPTVKQQEFYAHLDNPKIARMALHCTVDTIFRCREMLRK